MKLILDDSELEELKIDDVIKTEDKGVVHKPLGSREGCPDNSNMTKEIAAIDTINHGKRVSAEINGVDPSSASKYSRGAAIADDDTRARVLSTRFGIADVAVTKLMETLNLFDPSEMTKPKEIIQAASQLSNIVDKVSGKDNNNGQQVHLHMYAPNQKKVKDFDIIDV